MKHIKARCKKALVTSKPEGWERRGVAGWVVCGDRRKTVPHELGPSPIPLFRWVKVKEVVQVTIREIKGTPVGTHERQEGVLPPHLFSTEATCNRKTTVLKL